MENAISRQIILSIIGIFMLIITVIGVSYALFRLTLTGSRENKINTGTISMSYVESTNGISIDNAMPISDTKGKELLGDNEKFDFTISAKISGITTIGYEVVAKKVIGFKEQVDDNDVRIYLEKESGGTYTSVLEPTAFIPLEEESSYGAPIGDMLLYSSTFSNNESKLSIFNENFRLRMWLSDMAIIDEVSRQFQIKIDIYSKSL